MQKLKAKGLINGFVNSVLPSESKEYIIIIIVPSKHSRSSLYMMSNIYLSLLPNFQEILFLSLSKLRSN